VAVQKWQHGTATMAASLDGSLSAMLPQDPLDRLRLAHTLVLHTYTQESGRLEDEVASVREQLEQVGFMRGVMVCMPTDRRKWVSLGGAAAVITTEDRPPTKSTFVIGTVHGLFS
jgi:hypothetical protein